MHIEKIFEAFNKLRVLIIGDVMVDAYIWGGVERISPEAPVPIVRATRRDYRLGGAANVALNVQAMGAMPVLCAVVGEDEGGIRFKQRIEERGIPDIGLVTSKKRPTTVKTRILSGNHHVVRVDEEVDSLLSAEEEADLWHKISGLLPDADVIIFEDYDKGVISENLINRTVDMASDRGIPTVVDPKKRNFLNYKKVTLFKPNLKELREGLKIELPTIDKDSISEAVQLLTQQLEHEGSMITLSEKGVFIQFKGETHALPSHVREVSDVSGAGDTVISITALCVALDLSPFLIAALSNLGGGLVCGHVGVVPIDKGDLLKEALNQNW
ncbi:D-glycero-beta-D-manno-heptose-7-phosphate kinase [Fulvivirga sp. M361]|uniref:bifunctional heptose 7-phosphate kinase/heptose 1-phosphate adenyltransferase n=1 Tax=Fulvivirga sp. M361 TaxID=2594266 RepID=UPI001179DD81|nr:bifunctional ADP-heptose synthase [Fulvivirga sp. M361]TRX53078.1 D-glycero-beta-D-manno-heptose-7-phosphate kinase [Fulvivirga sp. M361]